MNFKKGLDQDINELRQILKQEAKKLKSINMRKKCFLGPTKSINRDQPNEQKITNSENYQTCTGTQDTFYVGWLRGVGRIYQQTFIHLESGKVVVKLYDQKNPLIATDFLNRTVLPWLISQDMHLDKVYTDRGAEYCGSRKRHPYQIYLLMKGIEHNFLEGEYAQKNRLCDSFHAAIFEQLFCSIFRYKHYENLATIQHDIDIWLNEQNYTFYV